MQDTKMVGSLPTSPVAPLKPVVGIASGHVILEALAKLRKRKWHRGRGMAETTGLRVGRQGRSDFKAHFSESTNGCGKA